MTTGRPPPRPRSPTIHSSLPGLSRPSPAQSITLYVTRVQLMMRPPAFTSAARPTESTMRSLVVCTLECNIHVKAVFSQSIWVISRPICGSMFSRPSASQQDGTAAGVGGARQASRCCAHHCSGCRERLTQLLGGLLCWLHREVRRHRPGRESCRGEVDSRGESWGEGGGGTSGR